MKITRIAAYQVDLPLHEGSYKWSGGKSVQVFDSTIVRVETDAGIAGHGEVCPLGPAYLPAYAAGARTGIAQLAPQLIGRDPTHLIPPTFSGVGVLLEQRNQIVLRQVVITVTRIPLQQGQMLLFHQTLALAELERIMLDVNRIEKRIIKKLVRFSLWGYNLCINYLFSHLKIKISSTIIKKSCIEFLSRNS